MQVEPIQATARPDGAEIQPPHERPVDDDTRDDREQETKPHGAVKMIFQIVHVPVMPGDVPAGRSTGRDRLVKPRLRKGNLSRGT